VAGWRARGGGCVRGTGVTLDSGVRVESDDRWGGSGGCYVVVAVRVASAGVRKGLGECTRVG
jgi:hypothetical protein